MRAIESCRRRLKFEFKPIRIWNSVLFTKHYIASGKNWKVERHPSNVSTVMSKQWKELSERYISDLLDKLESPSQPTLVGMSFHWNLWRKYESFSSELWDLIFTHPIQRFSFPVDSGVPPACVATLPGVVGSSSIEGNKAALGKRVGIGKRLGKFTPPEI